MSVLTMLKRKGLACNLTVNLKSETLSCQPCLGLHTISNYLQVHNLKCES